jgi:hypothetical protein
MTLEERLRLREAKGDLDTFDKAYKEIKESPIKAS